MMSFLLDSWHFYEALEKYNEARGDFLSFARLVIQSRIKDYWAQQNRYTQQILLKKPLSKKILMKKCFFERIEDLRRCFKPLDCPLNNSSISAPNTRIHKKSKKNRTTSCRRKRLDDPFICKEKTSHYANFKTF